MQLYRAARTPTSTRQLVGWECPALQLLTQDSRREVEHIDRGLLSMAPSTTGTWPPPCAGTTRRNGAPATPPADLPRLPAGSSPTPAASPVAPHSARGAELEPGGRTPREIAEVLAGVADAPARSPVRLLLAHPAAILAAPAVQTVREEPYDCHDGERALYRARDAATGPRWRRSDRHLHPRTASRIPVVVSHTNSWNRQDFGPDYPGTYWVGKRNSPGEVNALAPWYAYRKP